MPATPAKPPAQPAARLPKDLRKIVDKWLAETSTLMLMCRDAGHHWPSDFQPGETYGATREGTYAITHPCQRDGSGCGVKRTRHVGRRTGWLGKGSTYDYTGAKGYLLPAVLGSWSGARDTRGIIRLELQRRARAGETDQ